MPLLIEKYLFYFLLFSIPFQTRKILYFGGWRFNEWQSVSVYFTDVLLIILFLFWLFNGCSKSKYYASCITYYGQRKSILYTVYCILQSANFYLVLFVIFSALSLKNSSNLIIGGYQLAKLIEFVIFFFYLKNYAIFRFGFTNSLFAIFYGGLFQAVIAIAQFFKQSNIGLWYLGESVFNLDINGVASFYNFYGEKIIRAYGTTPHSNILAAYLFLVIFAFYFIWFYKKISYDWLLFLGHLVAFWAFLLTFARVAFFSIGANFFIRGFLLFTKFREFKNRKAWQLIICTAIVAVIFAMLYWPEVISRIQISSQEEAVQLRNFYNKESLQAINWIGTGMGDFIDDLMKRDPMLPHYIYQPVHNIYLLINSEIGVLGILTFVLFLIFLVKDFVNRTKLERFHHYSLLLLCSSFLFMGLFDHFLWTLQQGRFIFWLVLASLTINEDDDIM